MAPVPAVYICESESNDKKDYGKLDEHNQRVEGGAFLNSQNQDARDDQGDAQRWQIEAEFHPKQVRCADKCVGPRDKVRRLRCQDVRDPSEELLSSLHQSWVRLCNHVACDHFLRRFQRSPVIIGKPQREPDVKNLQKFDEVIGPPG